MRYMARMKESIYNSRDGVRILILSWRANVFILDDGFCHPLAELPNGKLVSVKRSEFERI